ncbi:DUF177 domain-containing protein [soil metagenome]
MSTQAVPKSDATLNLASLLGGGLDIYEVEDEGLLTPNDDLLDADGLRLSKPLSWHLTVRSTGGDDDFILEGETSGTALLECRRCLDEAVAEVRSSFIYPMIYRPGTEGLVLLENDADEEDTLQFGKPEVDFAPLITQLFAIDVPLTALCKETCLGLSPDGVNLNEHPDHVSGEQATSSASPFEALKDFEV